MALHDFKCSNGHVVTSTEKQEKCQCGEKMEMTFEFWNTVQMASPRSMERYSRGFYDYQLKSHVTSKRQRETLMKEQGFVSKHDFSPATIDKKAEADPQKAAKRHAAAQRAAHQRPDRENYGRWRDDVKKGKFSD